MILSHFSKVDFSFDAEAFSSFCEMRTRLQAYYICNRMRTLSKWKRIPLVEDSADERIVRRLNTYILNNEQSLLHCIYNPSFEKSYTQAFSELPIHIWKKGSWFTCGQQNFNSFLFNLPQGIVQLILRELVNLYIATDCPTFQLNMHKRMCFNSITLKKVYKQFDYHFGWKTDPPIDRS